MSTSSARHSDAPSSAAATTQTLSISQVLSVLRPEFPELSPSKLRFLEDRGLVAPARTPSRYRKYSHRDVERLRYALTLQRDSHQPLDVIRDHLDALDRGLEPATPGMVAPRVPRIVTDTGVPGPDRFAPPAHRLRLSRQELAEAADAELALVDALESYGLVKAGGNGYFDAEDVRVTQAAAALARYGIEPRHLRAFRTAADRELGLVEQVVAPVRHGRDPSARAKAAESSREVAALCLQLHAALVGGALRRSDS